MKDNRGFTLVELLITVAILSIVIISAAGFMLTGSRSFAKGSADSGVQSEAELAVNQIEDLIIDVNGGVDYIGDDSTDDESLIMYHVETDETSGLPVYKKRDVTWNKTDKKIYSSEWLLKEDSSTGLYVEDSVKYQNQLLAENVTAFNVDLSDIIKETDKDGNEIDIVRSVIIRVDCTDASGKAAYATTPLITLRNRMRLGGTAEEIFDDTPTPDENMALYISSTGMEGAVPIRDRVTEVERGKMYNIFAMVNASTNVNSLCDWDVVGEDSGHLSRMNVSGVFSVLEVDADEPNNYLIITASYKDNPGKTATGIVKVIGGEGKSLLSCKILPESMVAFEPTFTSGVTYTPNFTEDEVAQFQYKWSVSEPNKVEPFVSDQKGLELKVIKQPENYNTVFTIRLEVYSPTTGQTVYDTLDYLIDPAGTLGGDSLLERGKVRDIGYHGDNWYSFDPPSGFQAKEWEVDYYYCDIYGNRISAYDDLRQYVVIQVGQINYYLTFTDSLPPENEYYIKVVINYTSYAGDTWQYSRIHYIPATSLWGGTLHLASGSNIISSGFSFTYQLIGYYERNWPYNDVLEYEIVDFDCYIPEIYTITPEIGNTVDRTKTDLQAQVSFKVTPNDDWSRRSEVDPKSMTIKISMKDHPSIYTYMYIYFDK